MVFSLFHVQPPRERRDLRARAVVGGVEQPATDSAACSFADPVVSGPHHGICAVSVHLIVGAVVRSRPRSAGKDLNLAGHGHVKGALPSVPLSTVGPAGFRVLCPKEGFTPPCRPAAEESSPRTL